MDWFYSNVACRSAIKAGNKSTPEELIGIVKHLEEHPEIKYCPHGRPICIVLTKGEIENNLAGCDFWKNLLIRFQLSVLPHQANKTFG